MFVSLFGTIYATFTKCFFSPIFFIFSRILSIFSIDNKYLGILMPDMENIPTGDAEKVVAREKIRIPFFGGKSTTLGNNREFH